MKPATKTQGERLVWKIEGRLLWWNLPLINKLGLLFRHTVSRISHCSATMQTQSRNLRSLIQLKKALLDFWNINNNRHKEPLFIQRMPVKWCKMNKRSILCSRGPKSIQSSSNCCLPLTRNKKQPRKRSIWIMSSNKVRGLSIPMNCSTLAIR